jgi:hypothetical protein
MPKFRPKNDPHWKIAFFSVLFSIYHPEILFQTQFFYYLFTQEKKLNIVNMVSGTERNQSGTEERISRESTSRYDSTHTKLVRGWNICDPKISPPDLPTNFNINKKLNVNMLDLDQLEEVMLKIFTNNSFEWVGNCLECKYTPNEPYAKVSLDAKFIKPGTLLYENRQQQKGNSKRLDSFRLLAHDASACFFGKFFIPEGYDVSHLCHNKKCFLPSHLAVETHITNINRNKCQRESCEHIPRCVGTGGEAKKVGI